MNQPSERALRAAARTRAIINGAIHRKELPRRGTLVKIGKGPKAITYTVTDYAVRNGRISVFVVSNSGRKKRWEMWADPADLEVVETL